MGFIVVTHTHTHTHTRTGYDPVAKKITDQYRVLVSPKIIYLDPLNQLGLHEYMGVRSYSLCSLGRRVGTAHAHSLYSHAVILIPLFPHSHSHSHSPD